MTSTLFKLSMMFGAEEAPVTMADLTAVARLMPPKAAARGTAARGRRCGGGHKPTPQQEGSRRLPSVPRTGGVDPYRTAALAPPCPAPPPSTTPSARQPRHGPPARLLLRA